MWGGMDDLLSEFIAETRETLEALSGEIVSWEANPAERAHLDAIFRFVHTVKGSCGFLDLPRLARLSHAAEDVLSDVREGKRQPDRALVNAVLAVVDRIGEIVEAIEGGHALPDSGEDLLISALAEGAAEVKQAATPLVAKNASRSVRLNVDLLDQMMGGMSEMVLARNELARRLRGLDLDPAIEASLERLSATVADMRDTVTRTRMQKVDALFSALPRMVRDTAATCGKSVTLHIEGSDVELDREMIEVMRDPLVHIVRNAIDHGIEAPAERRAAGKRENGRLQIAARQAGNQILIDIADDGRGINIDRVIDKLVTQGRDEAELRRLSDKAKLDLIFEAGLTTKSEVTEISGRGVGMDVVRSCIEQIGGRIDLDNAPGRGLRISIHVPLTLSIIPTIVVGAGGQQFAIPRQAIEEIVSMRADLIRVDPMGGARVATVRGRRLPLVDLNDLLGLTTQVAEKEQRLVVVSIGLGSYAIAVDAVLDNEELVIKPAAPAIMAIGLFAGQTLPDNGLPMLILDCTGIAKAAEIGSTRDALNAQELDAAEQVREPGIPVLLFEDVDGARRAVPLGAVDRVEQVSTSAITTAAGRQRVTINGAILPLATAAAVDAYDKVAILRLRDGVREIGYAIIDSLDIVELDRAVEPAPVPGPVAGVTLLQGEPVEMLDLHWLFQAYGDERARADLRPICQICDDASGWGMIFLKPLIEATGYRVVTRLMPDEQAAVILNAGGADVNGSGDAMVLNLSSERADAAPHTHRYYRYDREGLTEALRSRLAGRV